MASRRFKRLRVAVSMPELNNEVIFGLANGFVLLADWPPDFVDANNDVREEVAGLLVNRHGIAKIRNAARKLGIVEAGQLMWCESLRRRAIP